MKSAKVSIIIPIYNVEKYLRRCLDSVQSQTFQDWQAILVDDGSPDKSGEIADEYAARDKRFVVIHKKNAGVSAARNDGLKLAGGKYVLFVDSDDVIQHQSLEMACGVAEKNNADIVSFRHDKTLYKSVANGENVDACLAKFNSRYYELKKLHYKKTGNLIRFATEKNHGFGAFKIRHCYPVVHLYKRQLLKNIKFNTDIKISEDFPFWTSVLLKNPRAVILTAPWYFYVPNNMSALKTANALKEFSNISMAIMASFNSVLRAKPNNRWINLWNRQFLWPFIITVMRIGNKVDDVDFMKKRLMEMSNLGVFNNPPTLRARKYKRRIQKFLSEN